MMLIHLNFFSVILGATVFLGDLGPALPLNTEFNCTGTESNLFECSPSENTSAPGSGATVSASSGDSALLQPLMNNSCQHLAVVNCKGQFFPAIIDQYYIME